jgi:glycosyltransferase involved in cell wall biosynthesis
LSPETKDSRWNEFLDSGISMSSLNMSRFEGLFKAKKKLYCYLNDMQPDVVQTQGIRADSLMSKFSGQYSWVMTSRNFPPEDYPSKFGRIKGNLMVLQHLSVMRKCKNLVSCSKTIRNKLLSLDIQSAVIQNGVNKSLGQRKNVQHELSKLKSPLIITVGSLIPRKNMQVLIDSFQLVPEEKQGSLLILGNGSLSSQLKAAAGDNVHFFGNVDNVSDYLDASDFFISTSLSEGLPNTVLEALASKLPVILSDIESHEEIANESPEACHIFQLKDGVDGLATIIENIAGIFQPTANNAAKNLAETVFSADRMSKNYQTIYDKLIS